MPNPNFDNTNVTSWMQNMTSTDWRNFGSGVLTNGFKSELTSRFAVSSNMQACMDESDNYDTTAKDRCHRDCNSMANWIDNGGATQLSTDIYDSNVTPILEQAFYLYLNFRRTIGNLLLISSAKLVSRSS